MTAGRGGSLAGSLLVAAPSLEDPHFLRAVVLLVDHDEEGAVGVVLNRPSQLEVASVLPVWSDLTAEPQVVFEGGPVGPESALALARVQGASTSAPPALSDDFDGFEDEARGGGLGVRHLVDDLCLLDLDADPDDLLGRMSGLRIYAGYAGWAPDQLEAEIAEQAWFVVPALPGDIFSDQVSTLWRDVLARQPGSLRLVASFPADPSLN